jgi:hypothetical protein
MKKPGRNFAPRERWSLSKMNDSSKDVGKGIRDRAKGMSSRLLDVIDSLLDTMQPKDAPPAPPIETTRRQVANTFRLWRFCGTSRCRRRHCCLGEPLNCLRAGIPLLPPESFAAFTKSSRGGAKRYRNRAAASAVR